MKKILNSILTISCIGIWGTCSAQNTFKEMTNSHRSDVIDSHFLPLFYGKGGYSNFSPYSIDSIENIINIKVPRTGSLFGIKGSADFFYELDTLETIQKIWITRLKISSKKSNQVVDDITFVDENHIGFELDYLREVDFESSRKALAIFLLEKEWKIRRFRAKRYNKWFDKELGNAYIHLLRVKFESEE